MQVPGTRWEYNDVRINQFSLALLHLFGRPLPEVFREPIMRPLGASENWRWVGYDNAWVEVGGRRVLSVPGGTHWGGGLSISANDQIKGGPTVLGSGQGQRPPDTLHRVAAAYANTLRDRTVLRLPSLAPHLRVVRFVSVQPRYNVLSFAKSSANCCRSQAKNNSR